MFYTVCNNNNNNKNIIDDDNDDDNDNDDDDDDNDDNHDNDNDDDNDVPKILLVFKFYSLFRCRDMFAYCVNKTTNVLIFFLPSRYLLHEQYHFRRYIISLLLLQRTIPSLNLHFHEKRGRKLCYKLL